MRTLQDFVTAIQQQDFFDPEKGCITTAKIVRHYYDENEGIVASRYAYVRVFVEERWFRASTNTEGIETIASVPTNGSKHESSILWVRFDDLKFDFDGHGNEAA